MSELASEDVEVDVEQPTTGHAGVDEVLASLTGLDPLPAAEHVAVFENAQERLRAALSEAGEDQASPVDVAAGDVSTGA
jgi:hypothetical protein